MISIGNAQGFWGDCDEAAAELLIRNPELQYLTLDYLAELSLSIMAIQKEKDPNGGYARDFLRVVESLLPFWREGARVKLITNAGGLNPHACGRAIQELLRCADVDKRVAVVSGDDVLAHFSGKGYMTANAYLGAAPCAEALRLGADIVVTGRVADPSLTVAPALYAFGWKLDDWNRIAAATVAGHLIECGPQVTGGIATHWMELPNPGEIEYPIVELEENGSFVVKGNYVSLKAVKEQLLYEIGDPDCYFSPDVTVSLMQVQLEEVSGGIRVGGIIGRSATSTYKVSLTSKAGYKCEGQLVIAGENAVVKARKSGRILVDKIAPARSCIEVLGSGVLFPGLLPPNENLTEVVLRVAAADSDPQKLEKFARQFAPFVTSGPPGTTGYSSGRPKVRPQFAYTAQLIDKALVTPKVELLR